MPQLVVTTRDGIEHRVEGAEGVSVMEVLRAGGIDEVVALCGGCCSCATCHVYVDAGDLERLPPMSADENDLLDSSEHRAAGSRLSCQLRFDAALDGLAVTVAPED
ncbi:2Fe-2S iron-sulfur cluster-binding protein [soil metagenome]